MNSFVLFPSFTRTSFKRAIIGSFSFVPSSDVSIIPKEHLENLNNQLLILEKEPENKDTIDEIFRAAHSLKGMAGTMGYKRMRQYVIC